jgi:ubiquinone/menaquinone biosynthesis C-methylase UbiE
MEVYKNIQKIKELYDKGENIIQYFRNSNNTDLNSLESILISYDFQSGTYTKQLKQSQEFNTKYTALIAEIIDNLTQKSTYIIMEAGVGEATTLGNVVKKLINSPVKFFGFDLSLSRLLYANKFLKSIDLSNYLVFTGNLFNIPVLSNSVNVVYTSHSIEPNGGKEKEALSELYRITKNYLVLFEPCYELASDEAKQRMERNGYVKKP